MTELNDTEVIDAGVKSMSDFSKKGLVPHFIYCGYHYSYTNERISRLRNIFLTKMRSYKIQSGILTMLNMYRGKLITKEKMKKAYHGKWKSKERSKYYTVSINDDLETFFDNLQNQQKINRETVWSFFTPKLTDEEMMLVKERNKLHLETYFVHYRGRNPDVNDEKMKRSDSKSKYVQGSCRRLTIELALKSNQMQESDDDL